MRGIAGERKVTLLSCVIRNIIPLAEHNMEHNTVFSRVTPRSIIFDFNQADPSVQRCGWHIPP